MATVAVVYEPRPWREELTPISRASRRRWAVAYAALLVYLFVYVGYGDARGAIVALAVGLLVAFGMLRRSTRQLARLEAKELDERDVGALDHAFRLAYPIMLGVFVTAGFVVAITLPEGTQTVVEGGADVQSSAWALRSDVLFGLVAWLGLVAVFLPTGVLAWLEPDALEDDEPQGGPPRRRESVRDALLLGALAIGLTLGPLAGSELVGVVPLLGVLASFRWGQSADGRASVVVRVLVGVLVLAALFLVVAVVPG